MASRNEPNMSDDSELHKVSLESILAEYKGSAYINGDKKTPADILNKQAESIIREALGKADHGVPAVDADAFATENAYPDVGPAPMKEDVLPQAEQFTPEASESQKDGFSPEESRAPSYTAPLAQATRGTQPAAAPASRHEAEGEKDSVFLFFENYRAPEPEPKDTIIKEVEKAIEREIGYEEEPFDSVQLSFIAKEQSHIYDYDQIEEEDDDESEIFEEPELKDALKRFAQELNSITHRFIPATIVTVIMVMLTLTAEAGMIIPFGIGRSRTIATGTLIIMLLVVMMLCVDLIIRGAGDLVRGAPNVETLILFSCAFSLISGAFMMLRGSVEILPYCAISAVSLTLAAFGERLSLRAITETLKTAIISSEPFGVQAEYNEEINRSVLKKAYNRNDGFYSNLMHPDSAETAYRYAAPILLSTALVLSVVKVAARGEGEYFLHTLSALLAAAAPFSAMLAFSIPFGIVAKTIRKSGAAIAGWGGADDICFTDGASVTDDDLFPPGTLSFSGVKMYEGVSLEKAIRYTASLIIASGSGLSHIFSEVLKTQKMEVAGVEDFACYEGGIGALIHGEVVMTGSAAFMNLLGIRIPDDMNMKNAVFTAVDDKLIALFAIEYMPVNSVQGALISMLKWRIKLYFAMRDFNITPLMLEQKFRVSLEDIEYIQTKDSYNISDSFSGRQGRMAALLAREGLGPFAEAITGGRLLKLAALVATAVSVVSAALGVIFMFYMFWNGSYLSAKPGNLLLFMLSTLAAVLLVCGYVKCRK